MHQPGEQSTVQQVIHHIKANLAFDLTFREAAELVHLNPSYFSKLFRVTRCLFGVKLARSEGTGRFNKVENLS